jgi:hypothetical protein
MHWVVFRFGVMHWAVQDLRSSILDYFVRSQIERKHWRLLYDFSSPTVIKPDGPPRHLDDFEALIKTIKSHLGKKVFDQWAIAGSFGGDGQVFIARSRSRNSMLTGKLSLAQTIVLRQRLWEDLWPCAAYTLDLNGAETRFPSRPCCLDCRKLWINSTVDFQRDIHSSLIACEAVQICASPTFLLSEGHSAFPDQRVALFRSRFLYAENPLLCPPRAIGAQFVGKFGNCWLSCADLKRLKTAWWTWSGSNRRPLPCHFRG